MLIFVLWTVANLVALRKESVGRNGFGAKLVHSFLSSLSARRAWIEMPWFLSSVSDSLVALRKESVDRNKLTAANMGGNRQSLSARRAWIEMTDDVSTGGKIKESLSARRAWIEMKLPSPT